METADTTEITVRPAVEGDVPAACDVVRRSIRELCVADHGNDENILDRWLGNKSEESVRRWITADSSFTVVALRGEQICGFGMIHESGEVQLCYVAPEARFLGVSDVILRALEQQARRWGLPKLFLTSTLTAKSFYERRGWTLAGDPIPVYGMKSIVPMIKTLAD